MPLSASNTILIVDDNPGARRSIEALLAHEPYRILLASSGAEALEIAASEFPDLILLDVMMPGMDGFEVSEKIRATPSLSEIPIIMITALDDEESIIKGIDAGADDFLSKPINKLELRSRVRGVLRLNRYRKLCAERLKFEWVVETATFGYALIDASQRIQFANPKAREMLRVQRPEDEPRSFFDIAAALYTIQPADAAERYATQRPQGDGQPFLLVRPQSAESDARWIRASCLDKLGQSLQGQTLIRLEDVTQNMRSFQEKHTFSRMISHKLLTPLNALKAAEQLLASAATDSSGTRALQRVFELQRKGLSRLEYDIYSILKFLETSSPSRQAPAALTVERAIETLDKIETDIGIPFTFESECDEPAGTLIPIASYNFEACAREIFENAIKFHPRGTPSLDCRVRVSSAGDQVKFVFLNDGAPLSEDELANAWKPYWQADRYSTGEVKGMGLGLALIATNVWSVGGQCSIANRADKPGAVVTLSFPARKKTPEASA